VNVVRPMTARTLYNLADVILPAGGEDHEPGGGDLDLVPPLEDRMAAWPRARRALLVLLLWWIEWQPLFALGGLRPFSRLPRERRAAAWRARTDGALPWAGVWRRLETLVRELYRERAAAYPFGGA
jgi:hypothetical protein